MRTLVAVGCLCAALLPVPAHAFAVPEVAADARYGPEAGPTPHVQPPEDPRRPDEWSIPRLLPAGPPPVPMPRVRPEGPPPVPMPDIAPDTDRLLQQLVPVPRDRVGPRLR